jgi:hypothetical protein
MYSYLENDLKIILNKFVNPTPAHLLSGVHSIKYFILGRLCVVTTCSCKTLPITIKCIISYEVLRISIVYCCHGYGIRIVGSAEEQGTLTEGGRLSIVDLLIKVACC